MICYCFAQMDSAQADIYIYIYKQIFIYIQTDICIYTQADIWFMAAVAFAALYDLPDCNRSDLTIETLNIISRNQVKATAKESN